MTAVSVPLGYRRRDAFQFREFFEMGLEESASPFLSSRARHLSQHFALKAAAVAGVLLAVSFWLSWTSWAVWSQPLLVAVYVIAGIPSLIDSVDDIWVQRDVNIDVLMTVAAFAAYFLGNGYEGGLLLVLFALSGALEELVALKAKRSLVALNTLVPTKANVVLNGTVIERAVQDIVVGARLFVRTGEIVPLDGVVVEGEGSVNLAHLTGESTPLRKSGGDRVPSGATLLEGSLTLEVTHTTLDSTMSRIITLIAQAREAKPKLARLFDRLGRRYAITIMALAVAFALFFAHGLGIAYLGHEGAIYRALAFLIAASPCALVLAVPIAYLSALSSCARKGIVLKGGVVLDALQECGIVAFDKTGTLTLGTLSLESIEPASEEALRMAASLERHAVHPIAKAVMATGAVPLPARDVRVLPGRGVEGIVRVGERDVPCAIRSAGASEGGAIAVRLEVGEQGYVLTFRDTPRPDVGAMLQQLERTGRKVVMLTGDNETSAARIARHVGIREWYADLRPEDKLARIEELSREHGLAMVGDGINDAPALARATVGIALGTLGSAATQEVADVILLRDNVEQLDWLFGKAAQTRKIVVQNLCLATAAIAIAAIPALCGIVPLWLAVILHEGGTVCVGLNALRLLRR